MQHTLAEDEIEITPQVTHYVDYMQACLKRERLFPSWLIFGAPGSGKKTLCSLWIRALCAHYNLQEDVFRAYDVMHVDGRQVGAEHIRDLEKFIRHKSHVPYRVICIDDADHVGWHGLNALLKDMEEPDGTLFMLTSSQEHAMLQTLISRCVVCYIDPCAGHMDQDHHKIDHKSAWKAYTLGLPGRIKEGSHSQDYCDYQRFCECLRRYEENSLIPASFTEDVEFWSTYSQETLWIWLHQYMFERSKTPKRPLHESCAMEDIRRIYERTRIFHGSLKALWGYVFARIHYMMHGKYPIMDATVRSF